MKIDNEDDFFVPEDEIPPLGGVNPDAAFRARDELWQFITGKPMSICCAAYTGNVNGLNKHIKDGADINKFADGQSPLHFACEGGSIDTTDILISKKADVNSKNKDGNTPLHLAMAKGNQIISEILVDSGADTKAKNNEGKIPGEDIEKNNVPDKKTKHDAILKAAADGNLEKTKKLADGYVLIDDARDSKGRTPLHLSCKKDSETVADILIRSGANVDAPDCDGIRPLHYAALFGAFNTTKLLLKCDAEVNVKDLNGHTPLDKARASDSLEKHKVAALISGAGGLTGEDI